MSGALGLGFSSVRRFCPEPGTRNLGQSLREARAAPGVIRFLVMAINGSWLVTNGD